MRPVILTATIVIGVGLFGLGCQHIEGEGGIDCTVIDVDTRAPVDSARVYATYVDYFGVAYDRYLQGLTDETGKFMVRTGGTSIHIVDVEKEGYLPSRQIARGGSVQLLFALEKVAP